jgi:hypothetical protein
MINSMWHLQLSMHVDFAISVADMTTYHKHINCQLALLAAVASVRLQPSYCRVHAAALSCIYVAGTALPGS